MQASRKRPSGGRDFDLREPSKLRSTRAEVDLFVVTGQELRLIPSIVPNNFPDVFQGHNTRLWITAVARGIDAMSNELRLQVDWDGQWEPGNDEMRRHLKVTRA